METEAMQIGAGAVLSRPTEMAVPRESEDDWLREMFGSAMSALFEVGSELQLVSVTLSDGFALRGVERSITRIDSVLADLLSLRSRIRSGTTHSSGACW